MILRALKKKIIDIESCKNTKLELLPSSVKKLAICKWWYNVLSFGKNREVIE